MAEANRNFKDSVFGSYFSSDKKRLIEAYNAISGHDIPLDAELELKTLEGALITTMYNDIAFTVDGRYVVFIEHQSTVGANLAARLLMYAGRVYESLMPKEALYSSRRFDLPTPEFYVIYNGSSPAPERQTLYLSDAFKVKEDSPALELRAEVFNIANGANAEVLAKSRALADYAKLVDIIQAKVAQQIPLKQAVHQAVVECIEGGIMDTYLKHAASEVENMLFSEWKIEDAIKYAEKEGAAKGEAKAHEQDAARMKADGMAPDLIAKYTNLTLEQVAEI